MLYYLFILCFIILGSSSVRSRCIKKPNVSNIQSKRDSRRWPRWVNGVAVELVAGNYAYFDYNGMKNTWRIYIKFQYNIFNICFLGTEMKCNLQRMPFHNSYYAKYIFLSNLSIYWMICCHCIPHSLKFTMQQWTMKHQATRHKLICIYSIRYVHQYWIYC